MNDDIQNTIKIGANFIKWILGILSALAFLGVIFWVIFYSVTFANLPFVMFLRSWYQNTYWNIEGIFLPKIREYPPFNPVYTILPAPPEVSGGPYLYQFYGTFVSADNLSGVLHLEGFDKRNYVFQFDTAVLKEENGFLVFDAIAARSPSKTFQTIFKSDYSQITDKSIIVLLWDDKRSLSEILTNYSKNPTTPLNVHSASVFLLNKIN